MLYTKSLPDGIEEYNIPSATWAIFTGEGTNQSIQDLEKRIVSEWLPTSGYEYGNAPDIEVYLNADPQNAKYEVWISVIRKENISIPDFMISLTREKFFAP